MIIKQEWRLLAKNFQNNCLPVAAERNREKVKTSAWDILMSVSLVWLSQRHAEH